MVCIAFLLSGCWPPIFAHCVPQGKHWFDQTCWRTVRGRGKTADNNSLSYETRCNKNNTAFI